MIAGALLNFIMLPDFTLGRNIGFVAGFLLLQALIIYFSAGSYEALKALQLPGEQLLIYLLRFLDLGGEILGVLGRALRPLMGPLARGLGAVSGFLRRFAFARRLVEAMERWGARLCASPTRRPRSRPTRPGSPPARRQGSPGARPALQPARRPRSPPASRASGPRARRSRPASAPGSKRPTSSARALPRARRARRADPRDDALKAAQFAEAEIAIRSVAETNDALNTPVPVVLGILMLLKRRYRWIDAFYATPTAPGHYRISSPRCRARGRSRLHAWDAADAQGDR